jgi:hypothetical protein
MGNPEWHERHKHTVGVRDKPVWMAWKEVFNFNGMSE